MAALNRLQIGLRKTGQSVTIPDAPEGRLMYYLDCICTVIDMEDNARTRRLRNYNNYYFLSNEELKALLLICLTIRPDVLMGKCIFQDDDLCGPDTGNEFYEINAVNTSLVVTDAVVIGGQRKRVQKIMVFKMSWLNRNYLQPMEILAERLRRQEEAERRRREMMLRHESRACVIL